MENPIIRPAEQHFEEYTSRKGKKTTTIIAARGEKPKKSVIFGPLSIDEFSQENEPPIKNNPKTPGTLVKIIDDYEAQANSSPNFVRSAKRLNSVWEGEIRASIALGERKYQQEELKQSKASELNSNDSQKYFLKDVALIFGGLNIDGIHSFKKYFPYNNCDIVIDYFNNVTKRKSDNIKDKSKSGVITAKAVSGKYRSTLGLVEFENQQRFFMKNKNDKKLKGNSRSKSPKRGASVFKRASKFGFSEIFKETVKTNVKQGKQK